MTENDSAAAGSSASLATGLSLCVPTSPHARAKRKIVTLMEEVETLKQDKAIKQRFVHSQLRLKSDLMLRCRKTIYYVSQGRAIRRMVALYSPIEDLIAENDRRCEDTDSDSSTE
jgi:hypothetical protein